MLVLDLATDVLRDLGIISEIATPSAEQGQQFVTKLNGVMASLEVDGINFGYNPKATTAESIALPDGHVDTIKALVGIQLLDSYGVPDVPPAIGLRASTGYARMLREAVKGQMIETGGNAPRGDSQAGAFNILTGY